MNRVLNNIYLPTALLNGLATLFFLGGITRELMARFGGSLEAVGCGMLLLMLWIIIGGISLCTKQYPVAISVIITALLPFTAIIGIMVIAILPTMGKFPLSTIIVTAAAGTMLFGLNSGIAYTLNSGVMKHNHYIGWVTGAVAGGVSYQFCADISMPEIFLLFGSATLLGITVFIKSFTRRIRVHFALLSILILIISGWLWQQHNSFELLKVNNFNSNSKSKSYEYPDGRYSVVATQNQRHGEFTLYKNGLQLWDIPNDCGEYSASTLFSAVQNISTDKQRVLLISSPFTRVPYLLFGLSNINSIDLLCRNRDFVMLAIYNGILPPTSPRFNVIINRHRLFDNFFSPVEFKDGYDLIMVFDNTAELLMTPRFFRQLKTILNRGGVITVSVKNHRQQTKKLVDCLRNNFRKVKVMHTNPVLIAAGDNGITVSTAELDARLAANSSLPAGTIDALYPVFTAASNTLETPNHSGGKLFNLPQLPLNTYLLLLIIFLPYFLLRFIMSRRHNNAIIFAAGENGFYATAFILITALFFQRLTGELYSRGTLLIATTMCGIAFGAISLKKTPKISSLFIILSVFLPSTLALLELPFIEQWPIEFTTMPLLGFAGITIGYTHIILRQKTTLINYNRLPLFEFMGGAVAIIMTIFHEIFNTDGMFIIIALTILRFITATSIIQFRNSMTSSKSWNSP